MCDSSRRVAVKLLALAHDLLVDRQCVIHNRRLDEHLPVVSVERLGADALVPYRVRSVAPLPRERRARYRMCARVCGVMPPVASMITGTTRERLQRAS